MSGLSDFAEGSTLLELLNDYDWYLSLHNGNPLDDDSGDNEVTGGGYERIQINELLELTTDGDDTTVTNINPVEFPTVSSSWGIVTHFAIYDAVSGGNQLINGILDLTYAVESGDTVTINDGAISFRQSLDPESLSTNALLNITYPRFRASNLSGYTILPDLVDHKVSANQNLISQFKNMDNILNFLDISFRELDTASADIVEFQSSALNADSSIGDALDQVGAVVGCSRIDDEADVYYRRRIKTQILVNICHGTLRDILVCLTSNYDLPSDARAKLELIIDTQAFNQPTVYVRNWETVYNNGGSAFVDKVIPAGAQATILVNHPETNLGGFFGLEGSDGQGLGTAEDPNVGGEMVAQYNRDLNSTLGYLFGLEGSFDAYGLSVGRFISRDVSLNTSQPNTYQGQPLPTTDSQLGVDTY